MTQQLQERRTQLASYLSSDPENPALFSELAVVDYRLGNTAEAQAHARQALQLSPEQAPAHAVLGLIAMATAQPEQAVEHLENAIALGDSAPLLHYQLAHALIKTGQYERAETHALHAAQHASELPLAPALYVRALHYLGKLEEAIAYGNHLIEQQSEHANAALLGTLASVHMDDEDLDNAERLAKLALQQNPDDTDSQVILGMLALAESDSERALGTFRNLTDLHPGNGRAWLGLGLAQMLTSPESAAEPLRKAARAMHNHPGTLITLAWTHILNKNAEEAESTLAEAMEVDRNFAEVHGSQAVVALMKGNLDGAVQASKRAHGLDPDNFSGTFASSLIQQLSGNREQAAATMERLLSLSVLPNGQPLHATIAQALAKRA